MNSKAPIQISNKGFTLIELIVGMMISTIIGGLALALFTNASTSFKDDKKGIETNQNLSAILDIIGNDIKQAGEQITDSNFPVLKISQVSGNANASTLTVRRAIFDNTLTVCGQIAKTTNPSSILVADNSQVGSSANCGTATANMNTMASPNLPKTLRQWRNLRCKQDDLNATYPDDSTQTTDYCSTTTAQKALEQLRGAVSDGSGHIRTFTYTSDATNSVAEILPTTNTAGATQYKINISGISADPTYDYNVGSPIYLIEERTYALNTTTGELTLSVNGGTPDTLIKGIEKFKVSSRVYKDPATKEPEPSPSPSTDRCGTTVPDSGYLCKFNDTQVNNWKTLAGVKIELQAKDPNGRTTTSTPPLTADDIAKLSSAAEFFPRNILSK
jgi:prepilin-type N-terminal cleavage/methylation domain-containing protein